MPKRQVATWCGPRLIRVPRRTIAFTLLASQQCHPATRPDALRLRPIDVVLADHHFWGGMIGCLALGQISKACGWALSQHSNNHAGITMAAMIHLAATVPEITLPSDTHYPWLVDSADIITGGKLPIRDGQMAVPTAPGVGVELDLDQLARAHEMYHKTSQHERDDAKTMRMLEPNWRPVTF